MQQLFQVNLRGIIELLSNHLYTGPQVFVRELLQNAVDAITARRELQGLPSDVEAAVRVAVEHGDGLPRIVFEDDGIGLTEAEIHQFLATLGESSKRRVGERDRAVESDLIGQFGIGLLACFLVSEEIVVRTRSRREAGAPCVEWRGCQDGTYSVAIVSDDSLQGGTRVSLAARDDRSEWFEPSKVRELLEHFGALLRCPVYFGQERIDRRPPWRVERDNGEALAEAVLEFGRACFDVNAMDWIQPKATLTVPKAFGGSGQNEKHELISVATLFADRARSEAGAFDRRNGNTTITSWTNERLALAALELELPER